MRLLALNLFILVLALSSVSARRTSSGGSRKSGGSSSGGGSKGGGWGSLFGGSKTSSKPASRPSAPTSFHQPASRPSAPTSFHQDAGSKSSTNFLHSESGRPSQPRPAQTHSSSPPYPTNNHGSFHPSPHQSNVGKPSVTQDQHQKNSAAPVSHSDPYSRQPATNPHANAPYVPSGGYGSHVPPAPHGVSVPTSAGHPPYPVGQPSHPHPDTSIRTSAFPSHSSAPIAPHSYPMSHNSYPSAPVGGYHPSAPVGGGYHPSYHAPPAYQPAYHSPPASQPFVPGKTVYVMQGGQQSKGPGIGSIIAGGVAGGVAAGATNAIVDHAISSIFRPSSSHVHTYPSAPPVGTPTHTESHVTNNYYYGNSGPNDNNQGNFGSPNDNNNNNYQPSSGQTNNYQPNSSSPSNGNSNDNNNNNNNNNNNDQYRNQPSAAPQTSGPSAQGNPGITTGGAGGGSTVAAQENPSGNTNGVVSRVGEPQPQNPEVPSNVVTDDALMKFTEELFDKINDILYQHVNLNLQNRVAWKNQTTVPDEAPEPLFSLKSDLDSIPTISTLRPLYDNYQRDGTEKENMTPERRTEEMAFLDEILKTPIMTRALDWLVDHKYIESDEYEKRDLLKRMWFNNFDGTSSGFERIFLSEKFGDSGIVGMQNWVYFAHLEKDKKVNYLGYVDKLNLSGRGELLKLNYETEGFTMQNATIFVGTPPELELSLYTVCFYARPNNWCPVSLGGSKFFILTHSFRYFGKDLIDLGFPAF